MVSMAAVASSANIADLGTKRLPCHTMRRLMYEVGVYAGSGRVGVEEFEKHQQKSLIKTVMKMTSSTPSSSRELDYFAVGTSDCNVLNRLGQSRGYGRTIRLLKVFYHDFYVVMRSED